MRSRNFISLIMGAILVFGCGVLRAQAQGPGEGTPTQRLDIMSSRLEAMRRSLNSALASMNSKDSSDEKANADDPRVRLRGLEQEVSSMLSEVSDLRSKYDRAERVDSSDLTKLETSVTDLNTRVQSGLQATANVRSSSSNAAPTKKKKKGKFLGLFGGGGGDDKYADLTEGVAPGRDRELFEVAAKEVRKGNFDTGRLLFNTIINTYPDSPFLPLSKLAIADSFYLEGTTSALIQAAQAYQDWRTFFPTDPLSDRVMLKEAEAEMRQMGLANRDVTRARKAEQRLKAVLQQFPSTSIRQAVEQRLYEVQENLGMHSLQIARFYQDKYVRGVGGLKGAQSRLREIVEKYPKFSYMDEVLFRLGWLYVQEEEPDEAAKYFTMVARDYPSGDFSEKAREELTKIGVPVPEPDPIKVNMPKPERPGMMSKLFNEVAGSAHVTVDTNGILISKDSKAGNDLIDEAIANGGQLRTVTPVPVEQRRQPPRTFPQGTTGTPGKAPAKPATAPTTQPTTQPTTPASTVPVTPTGTKP
ncbi:MAG: outer membrane protein assembly factor BamD [Acidobacteriota bacterium]|jgi:outer membrane protein assembly factor BamD|nr:outer membrane protein assembly factor BamD [Acidobacteriota bacterium]